jgi:hypothetical protein
VTRSVSRCFCRAVLPSLADRPHAEVEAALRAFAAVAFVSGRAKQSFSRYGGFDVRTPPP